MSAAMLAAAPSALQRCCVASTSGRAPAGGAPLLGLSKRGARNFRAEQLGCRYSSTHAAWFSGPALQCSFTSAGAANLAYLSGCCHAVQLIKPVRARLVARGNASVYNLLLILLQALRLLKRSSSCAHV